MFRFLLPAHTRLETPLSPSLASELASFWEDIFGTFYERFWEVLTGDEKGANRNLLYLVQDGSDVVASTLLTLSLADSRLGGLGEVATASAWRRRGLGRHLSQLARDEFWELGGEAIVLRTVNPQAVLLYESLGWRKLTGANVMCLVWDDRTSEDFFADYFQPARDFCVRADSAADRLGMIPLILCLHEQRVLDANLGLFSTRLAVQNSCMGLFPRYQALSAEGMGEWFVATTESGSLVGLARSCRWTPLPIPTSRLPAVSCSTIALRGPLVRVFNSCGFKLPRRIRRNESFLHHAVLCRQGQLIRSRQPRSG